jgi:hypothetical protein
VRGLPCQRSSANSFGFIQDGESFAEHVQRLERLIVVPEAEPFVAAYRRRYDPSAAVGVPAHVTILYPLRSVVDGAAADAVAELAADVAASTSSSRRWLAFPARSSTWPRIRPIGSSG